MPKQSKTLSALSKLARETSGIFESASRTDTLAGYDDRALAIVLAADTEEVLKEAIMTKFVALTATEETGLFGTDAPLSSLSGKIRMAYALNIVGKDIKHDLDIIRSIRNAFAHSRTHISFSTPEVKAACDLLRFINTQPAFEYAKERSVEWPPPSGREKYSETAQYLCLALACIRSPGLEDILGQFIPPLK